MWDNNLNLQEIIQYLQERANPENVNGMARFGVATDKALGLNVPQLKQLARKVGKDHELAQQLWQTEIHEARHLAALIDGPKLVDEKQLETWVKEFDSWDICDGCCNILFRKTPFAHQKAAEWSSRTAEY